MFQKRFSHQASLEVTREMFLLETVMLLETVVMIYMYTRILKNEIFYKKTFFYQHTLYILFHTCMILIKLLDMNKDLYMSNKLC